MADFSLDGATSLSCPVLPRHRNAQAFRGRDQVVGVLGRHTRPRAILA
jgi:hypothetical protein